MDNVLDVRNLSITFRSDEGAVRAVDDVSFSVGQGRTLGIVGESGSGKSVSTKALMQLLPRSAQIGAETAIRYRAKDGEVLDITKVPVKSRRMRELRGGEIGMIFQEPMASFSPVYTVGAQMVETIRLHRGLSRKDARAAAIAMLKEVGIANPEGRIDAYAFELSGGMRQRAMIALALSAEPRLLIADEPTTALDVTIQAQVLRLMRSLQEKHGMAMLFITHDLGVIAQVADDVAVMYLGTIVERGAAHDVLRTPKHPYTQGLLGAIPRMDALDARMKPVPGDIPNPSQRPTGCAFHPRCDKAVPGLCDRTAPPEFHPEPGRAVRCHLYGEGAGHKVAA
ncbi:ABC transporter ATP-binding protein [Acuticoccus sp. MNP-M23]|uniref:ABC transporter ATP-binding protein n=1 Tax=Acuticoccus sp. MNP-M23 TaxID=3072793 RepID=UPI002815F311|nr:ABC transporter ATP-binding protein [Acuticoccus sp. MNP-M23]WMS40812.1 ABC transporter ATP-binding protein [Acuticoccus sp. MNP-M23]